MNRMTIAAHALAVATLTVAPTAFAAGTHAGGHGAAIGQPAKASAASRTVEVTMHDTYYEPESVTVKPGETVRFVVRNEGQLVHEFNIGTAAMHAAHQDEMRMMVDHGVLKADHIDHQAAQHMQATMGHGMHKEPNSLLLEPGKTGEIAWTFPEGADLEFACNVPGHYEAGMQGEIELAN
jgi:uncharacterized cupredoxin-like copper-binding protein